MSGNPLEAALTEDERESLRFLECNRSAFDIEQACAAVERILAARATAAADWPCANYAAPVTCLTAPSTVTGRCDFCRDQATAADPLRRAVEALGEVEQRVHALQPRGSGGFYVRKLHALAIVREIRAAITGGTE